MNASGLYIIQDEKAKLEKKGKPGLDYFLRQVYHNLNNGTLEQLIKHFEDELTEPVDHDYYKDKRSW